MFSPLWGITVGAFPNGLSVFLSREEFPMARKSKIRLLIADDHEVLRSG